MIQEVSSPVSGSVAMLALADYVSSPSSYGSWMFSDLPEILISTGAFSQTQVLNDRERDNGGDKLKRMIWLKRPFPK